MKLLIKFPTRERPKKFFQMLDSYYSKLANIEKTEFVISCDSNDPTMNTTEVINRFGTYKNLNVYYGTSKHKIDAINRDVEKSNDWDIVFIAQDDLEPVCNGFDQVVRYDMAKYYPDTDGALWYAHPRNPGYCANSIIGRKYYNRFGYIYYPEYTSCRCDPEFTEVAQRLGKITYIDRLLVIPHRYRDGLDKKNKKGKKSDWELYHRRKKMGFPKWNRPEMIRIPP
jgi:hypothetical protein